MGGVGRFGKRPWRASCAEHQTSTVTRARHKLTETERHFLYVSAQGEKRTPYITRDPEKYYTATGEWRGWAHYLGYGGEVFEVTDTEPPWPMQDKPGVFTKCT
jgi:hypothetical protein